MWTTALFVSLLATDEASAKEYKLDPKVSAISLDDAIKLVPQWIDVTGTDYVILMDIQNNGTIPIVIRSEGMRCVRGAYEGPATYGASFGIGERSIDVIPGEVKSVKLLCKHGAGVEGDFALKIARVDVDLGQTTKTVMEVANHDVNVGVDLTGDALFTNITWQLAEAHVEKKQQKLGKQLATGSYDRPTPAAAPAAAPVAEATEEAPPPPPASIVTAPE